MEMYYLVDKQYVPVDNNLPPQFADRFLITPVVISNFIC